MNPTPKITAVSLDGEILPAGWDTARLKMILTEPMSYGANEAADSDDPSGPRYIRITDIAPSGSLRDDTFRSLSDDVAAPYMLSDGDLLFARSGATVGKTLLYSKSWGRCCYAGYLIRARVDQNILSPDYLKYFTMTNGYWQHIYGEQIQATIQNVSAERFGNIRVPIPPKPMQQEIVTFLDDETSKIDLLISKQEKLVATLREDRIATIANTVTKGLDPSVKMKNSGTEWIGTVPEHWTVSKVKHGFSVTLGKMYQGEATSNRDSWLPHLKAGSITESGLNMQDPMMCWFSPRELDSLSLKAGDVLVVEGGAIGRCAVLNEDLHGWGFQKSLNRVRALRNDSPQFLAFLLNAATASGHVSVLCGKSTIPHFTAEKLEALEWPHPDENEQQEIVDYLTARCAKIDSLINKALDVVNTVREYRSALITAAVTGKIDVRGAA